MRHGKLWIQGQGSGEGCASNGGGSKGGRQRASAGPAPALRADIVSECEPRAHSRNFPQFLRVGFSDGGFRANRQKFFFTTHVGDDDDDDDEFIQIPYCKQQSSAIEIANNNSKNLDSITINSCSVSSKQSVHNWANREFPSSPTRYNIGRKFYDSATQGLNTVHLKVRFICEPCSNVV